MSAPVCPSLPQSCPSLGVGTGSTLSGGAQSPQTTSTTGTLVGGSRIPELIVSAAPVSAPVSPKASDLIRATFQATLTYLERNGTVVKGPAPDWTAWPSVNAADIPRKSPVTPKAKKR